MYTKRSLIDRSWKNHIKIQVGEKRSDNNDDDTMAQNNNSSSKKEKKNEAAATATTASSETTITSTMSAMTRPGHCNNNGSDECAAARR